MKIIKFSNVPEEDRGGYVIKRLLTEPLGNNPENIGFYLTTVPPNSKVKLHYHPLAKEVLIFLTKGVIATGEKKVDIEQYNIVFLDPGEKHEISSAQDEIKLIAIRMPNLPDDKVVC